MKIKSTLVFLFCVSALIAQPNALSLKQIVHRPLDGFKKAPRVVKVDAGGGTVDFDLTYGVRGSTCTETYRLSWKFDENMRFLRYTDQANFYDFEIQTERINGNCGPIQPWRNPFVVAVANDVSNSAILSEQGYDEVQMAKGLFGGTSERIFFRDDEWVRFNQARQGFIRGRFFTRKDNNSYGKYTWFKFTIVGNSNLDDPKASFQYEIVYVYEIPDAPQYVNRNTLTLGIPILRSGIGGPQNTRGFDIRVPGELAANSGKQFQLIAFFETQDGRPLRGNPGLPMYTNQRGYATTESELFLVPPEPYRLEQVALWMPYAALNLSNRSLTGIYTFVELWIDGKVAARSPKVAISGGP
ncbi:MAG TPA: hypothetical protein VJ953_22845 [Saprospiraceae bacterium]|nr:hypothetical protein [Saprospiraceae bacterium]